MTISQNSQNLDSQIKFVQQEDENILFSGKREVKFYRNNFYDGESYPVSSCITKIVITTKRIISCPGPITSTLYTMFVDSDYNKKLGLLGFEISKENISNFHIQKIFIHKVIVIQAEDIAIGIPVSVFYFADKKIINALSEILKTTLI